MKLLIKKSTKDARLGTLSFLLYARLEVDHAELALLDRCNLLNDSFLLHIKEQGRKGLANALFAMSENTELKVHHVIEGRTLNCARLDELIELESQLLHSGATLEKYVTIAASFGSEEVIDLKALNDKESC